MKGKTIPEEIRNKIIELVKEGRAVSDFAREYGISPNTIYRWLGSGARSSTDALTIAKLKREKQELIELLGKMTLLLERSKKNLKITTKLELARGFLRWYPKANKTLLSKYLGLNRSSLNYKSILEAKDLALKSRIQEVLSSNPCYGSPRVAITLSINPKRVCRVMCKFSLKARLKKPTYRKVSDLGNPAQDQPNLLKPILEHDELTGLNHVWCSDFTYLRYKDSFLYLATVIDCFTKEIVGFRVSTRHTQELILGTIQEAILKHGRPHIFHSDQGSEYTGYLIQDYLKYQQIKQSFSTKASPWENGSQESFYGKLKLELPNLSQCQSLGEVVATIYRQIHYYNYQRIHTKIKMSPIDFKRLYLAQNRMENTD